MKNPIWIVLLWAAFIASAQDEQEKEIADLSLEELTQVRITPFEVSTKKDIGYHASNTVSGSRTDTPIGELPFALQAFTQSFIEDQKPETIFDIAKYSPGVTYRSNDFNEGNANMAIRGFAISSTPSSAQILRDGFRGPSIFDFTNITRVEVVKGPASFLYGQLAPGGVVNIITKNPESEFKAEGRATYGSYDSYRLQADVTGPAKENLYYRFATTYNQDIGYWDAYDAHSINLSPSLLWQIDQELSVTIKYENFAKRESPQIMQKPGYNTQTGIIPTASDPNLSGVDVPNLGRKWNSMSNVDFRNSDTHTLNTLIDYKANQNWNLRAGHSRDIYRIDAVFSGNLGMANNSTRLQGRRFRRTIYVNKGDTLQADAIGKYQFNQVSLQILLGAQLINRRFESNSAQAPNDPSLGNDPVATPLPYWDLTNPATWNRDVDIPLSALTESRDNHVIESKDNSVYLGTTWGFFDDQLRLLTGLRQTSTISQKKNYLTQVSDSEITAKKQTPQYGILYKLIPEVSIFASYAESFVPGPQILNIRNVPTKPAKPTEGKGYDIGVKTDLFDNRVSATLTIFEVKNKNIINDISELNPDTGQQIFTNVQSGEQRSRGIELDATISPFDNWQIYFSYSYMDAKITEFSGKDKAILAQDPTTLDSAGRENYKNVKRFHNAPLQMSAPHLSNLWTRYSFTQDNILKGYFIAGGFNFVKDQTLLSDAPKSEYQNYTLLNALAGRSWKWNQHQMKAEIMAKNISNKYYRPSQSSRSRPRELLFTFVIEI